MILLKVKDNIDLNMLKKYGFRQEDLSWKPKDRWYNNNLTVCSNRTIQFKNGGNWNRNDELYEMIIDGIVEKVVDKK